MYPYSALYVHIRVFTNQYIRIRVFSGNMCNWLRVCVFYVV